MNGPEGRAGQGRERRGGVGYLWAYVDKKVMKYTGMGIGMENEKEEP